MIARTIGVHAAYLSPGNSAGRNFPGWPDLVGSEVMQLYAIEVLAAEEPAEQPSRAQQIMGVSP